LGEKWREEKKNHESKISKVSTTTTLTSYEEHQHRQGERLNGEDGRVRAEPAVLVLELK